MKLRAAITFMALLLLASAVWAADGEATENDNRILALALKRSYKNGRYTVVEPKTGFLHPFESDAKELEQDKQYITESFRANDAGIAKLADQFFERNKKPAPLTLKSSPQDGYVIDFDGKYAKYFHGKGGGGWEKWYKENPKAHGMTQVSLPAYDPKTGLVLIYIGTQSHWLAGAGFVILYKYENGKLVEIKREMMWIS